MVGDPDTARDLVQDAVGQELAARRRHQCVPDPANCEDACVEIEYEPPIMNADDKDRDLHKRNAVVDESDTGISILVPAADARRWRLAGYSAAAAVFVGLCVAAWFVFQPQPDVDPLAKATKEEAVVLAAFPVRPFIPDFAPAGLKLRDVAYRKEAGGPLLVATYKGPRGCRLELYVRPSGRAADLPAAADRKHQWSASGLTFALVAFGMPETRFALVAGAAERQTRLNADPGVAQQQLRQAAVSPPCIG